MKTILLTRGRTAIVDDEDYERVSAFKWHALRSSHCDTWYAVRAKPKTRGRGKIKMHRFIMGAPDGLQVDHKDGNGLDNRRDNLRTATNRQNQYNRRISSNNTTGYKGVYFRRNGKRKRRYEARVHMDGKMRCVGIFLTAEEAARAYDAEAGKIYGEFAKLNFALQGSSASSVLKDKTGSDYEHKSN